MDEHWYDRNEKTEERCYDTNETTRECDLSAGNSSLKRFPPPLVVLKIAGS
jgi:hypothetical protein